MKCITRLILFSFFINLFFNSSSSGYASQPTTISNQESQVKNFEIEIQSGLEIDENNNKICKKSNCKINLTVENYIETLEDDSYTCQWYFAGGTWKTENTDKKCNPGYIDYEPGAYTVEVEIQKKNNGTIIAKSVLEFENTFYPDILETSQQQEVLTLSGEIENQDTSQNEDNLPLLLTDSSTGVYSNEKSEQNGTQLGEIQGEGPLSSSGSEELHTTLSGSNIVPDFFQTEEAQELLLDKKNTSLGTKAPEIIFEIQSGLEHNGSGQIYLCKKEECKVNLSVEKIFTGAYLKSNYECQWDFGSGSFTTKDTDKKCNPGFINYTNGNHEIQLKISQKNDPNIFSTGALNIIHDFSIETEVFSGSIGESQSITQSGSGKYIENKISVGVSESTSSSGEILIGKTSPEVAFEIQSGLEYSGSGQIYLCKKEECKVNLSVEKIFTGTYIQKDYQCQWDFGSGSFTTQDTDKKCNPGFVNYTNGNHEIQLKISQKNDPNIFSTGALNIIHDFKQALDLNSEVLGLDKNLRTATSSDTNIELEPESYIDHSYNISETLQQPSYVKKVSGIYECDRSKKECKVNFDFKIFKNSSPYSKVRCKIYTKLKTKTIDTCNPATLTVPKGETNIDIDILDPETLRVVYHKKILIKNEGYQAGDKKISQSSGTSTKRKIKPKITISDPIIEVQSGLDENFKCKREKCNINLIYRKKKGEKCKWKFPGGTFKKTTALKCNPGYISYTKYGNYTIELRVYDKNYDNNFKIKKFHFSHPQSEPDNNKKISNIKKIDEKKVNNISSNLTENIDFETTFYIELQGKKTDYKSFSGTNIICSKSPCNINLDGSSSSRSDGSRVDLEWHFGEQIFSGNNPKAIWFPTGIYDIKIKDQHNNYFLKLDVQDPSKAMSGSVDYIGKLPIDKHFEYNSHIYNSLKINSILANPKGIDSNEYIELINNGESTLNLQGIVIDDMQNSGSKAFMIKEPLFLAPGETKKFYKFQTFINLNNSGDTVTLSYNSKIVDTIQWNFEIAENYIINHENIPSERLKVFVSKVIDGDTIEIKLKDGTYETVRLIGVDSPEIYNTKNSIEKFYGEKARSFLQSQLLSKTVELEFESINSRDTYGRLLGYIIGEDQININEQIILNGYSRAYLVYEFKYHNLFKKAQNIAKKNKLGFWESTDYKKTVNKIIKKDEEIRENILKTKAKYEKNKFYLDNDSNKIPDSFSADSYKQFINDSFYLKTSTLQSGVKFSGKTIPSAEVNFSFGNETYSANSNAAGEFSIILGTHFTPGIYNIRTDLKDLFGNIFTIKKQSILELEESYIQKIQNIIYLKEKKEEEKRLKALQKKKEKAAKIIKNSSKNTNKKYTNIFVKQTQAFDSNLYIGETRNSNILTYLIFILLLVLAFLILHRKKLV